MLLLGEEAVIRCCVGAASLECCRLPAAVVVVVRSMRGPAARVRACQSGWGWMRARPVRRFVYTYSQCAVLGPGPGGAGRPFSVPLLERGYALFAEPAGGTRSGGTCQSQLCHHPSGAMPSSPSPPGVRGRAARARQYLCHYPSGAMPSSPSPPGVRGRAARVSFQSCHYPSGAMPSSPSPPGVSGRAARVSQYLCHYPSGATPSSPSPPGVSGRAARVSFQSCHYPSGATPSSPSPPGVSGRAVRVSPIRAITRAGPRPLRRARRG